MSILKAWALDGKGGGVRLNGDAVLSALEANKTVWVHLDASAASTKSALMKLRAHLSICFMLMQAMITLLTSN